MFYWNVDPILVQLGPVTLHWYGLLFVGGFLLGFRVMQWICQREGYPTEPLESLLLYMFAGAIIGARLAHVLFYDPEFYFAHPIEILKIWHGGLASHGGTVGVIIAIWLFLRKYPQNGLLWWLDRLVIPTALTACFIRLGNFMNSEIVGLPTGGNWGVVFARIDNLPRHPVQLYEAFSYLAIFILLFWLYRRNAMKAKGFSFGLFMILVFGSRFLLEFVKTPQASYEAGNMLTVGQWLSIPFVLLGIFFVWRSRYRRPKAV